MKESARMPSELIYNVLRFFISKGKRVKIEGIIGFKISAELEIFHSQVALTIVIRQKLQIQIKILNDRKYRCWILILLFVMLKFFNILAHLFSILPAGEVKKRIVKIFSLKKSLINLRIILNPFSSLPNILIPQKVLLVLNGNFTDRRNKLLRHLTLILRHNSMILDILLLNVHFLQESQLLILDHQHCVISIVLEINSLNLTQFVSRKEVDTRINEEVTRTVVRQYLFDNLLHSLLLILHITNHVLLS